MRIINGNLTSCLVYPLDCIKAHPRVIEKKIKYTMSIFVIEYGYL